MLPNGLSKFDEIVSKYNYEKYAGCHRGRETRFHNIHLEIIPIFKMAEALAIVNMRIST